MRDLVKTKFAPISNNEGRSTKYGESKFESRRSTMHTPTNLAEKYSRVNKMKFYTNFTRPNDQSDLSNCDLSPIGGN